MLQSKLFPSTQKQAPKEAISVSHKLLAQAGYIDQLSSGIWNFLPLGWRTHQKINNLIRQEINKIGGQELFLPSLQPKELWLETERWDTIDPPLFKLKDRHKKELGLGSTHEEVITYLARKFIRSYKDLPLALYQIQNKFRNELRATAGLLRTREFIMKDLYSFHANEKDLDEYYKKAQQAYKNIFQLCGLDSVMVRASSGTIGGKESHEFMILAESGEDTIIICEQCGFGANLELGNNYEALADKPMASLASHSKKYGGLSGSDTFAESAEASAKVDKKCPNCQGKLTRKKSIESGHIFKLGTTYSQKMNANFVDQDGKQQSLVMGCYGIGVGRLMATIAEVHNDADGLLWPKSVAPFDIHLLSIDKKSDTSNPSENKIQARAEQIYQALQGQNFEVLYDDRKLSPGNKLKDADLIGIPIRLVVSEKTGDKIEFKERGNKEVKLLGLEEVIKILKNC